MVEPMTDEELARLRAIAARGGRVPLGSCAKLLARLEQVETERDKARKRYHVAQQEGIGHGIEAAIDRLNMLGGYPEAEDRLRDLLAEEMGEIDVEVER